MFTKPNELCYSTIFLLWDLQETPFSCTEMMEKDRKIKFSVIFYMFSYEKNYRTHSFNFPTEKQFPAK